MNRRCSSVVFQVSQVNLNLLDTWKQTKRPSMSPSAETAPITNEDLTPHQIAIKRTKDAKARLATAHEGWTMIAQTLVKTGIASTDKALSEDMKAFGDAMIGRYAAASFLWRVLTDMPTEDWFGPKEKFDGTLRRLKTLKGLEGTLICWEKIILDLLELVDEKTSINDPNALGQKVKEVLQKWHRGMPSTP